MGLFDKFKKKDNLEIQVKESEIYAPIAGKYISMKKIPDEVFATGVLGDGCGIEPAEGIVYSPVNGTISTVADTLHAIGINGEHGEEFLIHVGMDTVEMQGKGFKVLIKKGDQVKAGQRLMEFDLKAIEKAGYPTTSAFLLTNSDEYKDFTINTDIYADSGEKVGYL